MRTFYLEQGSEAWSGLPSLSTPSPLFPSPCLLPPSLCERNPPPVPLVIGVASWCNALCKSLALSLPASFPLNRSDPGHFPQAHQCAQSWVSFILPTGPNDNSLLSPASGSTRSLPA